MHPARFPSILLASPAKLFCSWISVGMPRLDAAHSRGALAYPPTPMAMSGRKLPSTFPAILTLFSTLNGRARFEMDRLRLRPATGRPMILYPAAGTFSISILPSAPTKRISLSGLASRSFSAIERAGKMWPPVPPPLIIAFIFLYSIAVFLILFRNCVSAGSRVEWPGRRGRPWPLVSCFQMHRDRPTRP